MSVRNFGYVNLCFMEYSFLAIHLWVRWSIESGADKLAKYFS